MNEADRSPRWFHPWRGDPAPAAEDPADMGTAFGLDLSLQGGADAAESPAAEEDQGWRPHLQLHRRPG